MWTLNVQRFGYTWNYHVNGEWLGSVGPVKYNPCDGNNFSASWVYPSSGHPMNGARTKTEEEAKTLVEKCSMSLRKLKSA